uniref:C-type lectin domain-containing protein n=1 Tax=Scylla olivacea TaxID=85551 RepID=A0A0P4W890_SCYOL
MATIAHSKFQYDQNCFTDFWIGPNDIKEEGVWMMDGVPIKHPIIWKPSEPNGLQYENCGAIAPIGVSDLDCDTNLRCTVCSFKDFQRFSFVGTCESELRNVYFTAFQLDEEELMFMGYGAYHIKRLNDTWAWINVVTNKTIAFLLESVPDFPMGRRWWQLEQPVCEQKDGDRRLLLSPCPAGYFSCNDATCIPLPHRCDLKYDCRDNSDEYDCKRIFFPQVRQ